MREHAVDPARVYVAGLSAGGAAAAIMGAAYPDLYAGIGIHSGLACGAARDMASAFAAMKQGAAGAPSRGSRSGIRTIIFHGDADRTVHPANGEHVMAQFGSAAEPLQRRVVRERMPDGTAYTRTIESSPDGVPMLEHWLIHGAGHAWSGGSQAGSYTDARGPDASREMLRFFLESGRETAG
jgi:poly(3-hydroxybutyrate) depolymerase